MSINNSIQFPKSKEIYPPLGREYYHGKATKRLLYITRFLRDRTLHAKQCANLVEYLNQHPIWIKLFKEKLIRFNGLLECYADKRFGAQKRLETLKNDMELKKMWIG